MSQDQGERQRLGWRPRCYTCFRPVDRCFCLHIPKINNRTNVLILQHRRERLHPFNTARILRSSLSNSRLFADHIDGLAKAFAELSFSNEAALLYPGDGSQLLDELSPNDLPKQLIVLDGTWHHTKTLFRDIPQLRRLPRVRLAPTQPSGYGIRREPHILFLSTLEATVAALRFLEPETLGLDQLVAAFEFMVKGQLAHPKSADSVRRKCRPRAPLNVPKELRNNLQNIVVLYGETAPSPNHVADSMRKCSRAPVYWVAERLGTGERFERAILSSSGLTDSFLEHLGLPLSVFADAVSIEEFRDEWRAFLRPTDTLAYYYANCTRLLNAIDNTLRPKIYLKSIQLHRGQKNGTLEELLTVLHVPTVEIHGLGRPSRRLANTIALCRYLHTCELNSTASASHSRQE